MITDQPFREQYDKLLLENAKLDSDNAGLKRAQDEAYIGQIFCILLGAMLGFFICIGLVHNKIINP